MRRNRAPAESTPHPALPRKGEGTKEESSPQGRESPGHRPFYPPSMGEERVGVRLIAAPARMGKGGVGARQSANAAQAISSTMPS
jgi:hypothetical protein